MELATRQYFLDNSRVGNVPSCSLWEFLSSPSAAINRCNRITRMPAQRDDTTTTIVVFHLFRHTRKRHTIQVFLVAHLDASEVEAHDGRIVTTHVFHITGIFVILPCKTIHRIVLMTKHDASLLERIQTTQQLLSLCLFNFCFLLSCTSNNSDCCDCYSKNLFHNFISNAFVSTSSFPTHPTALGTKSAMWPDRALFL